MDPIPSPFTALYFPHSKKVQIYCSVDRESLLVVAWRSTASDPHLTATFRVVLGWAYRGLTGGFLLPQNFSVAISVSPHVCFILVLILIYMFLR